MPGEEALLGMTQQMAGNIGAGASGLLSGITGFFQRKQGKQLLRDSPRPTETIPAEVLANQQAAQQQANEGMPSQQYQQANKNIQQQQATAINAAQDRRSGTAAIGAIQQGTNNATSNLDAQSAGMRRDNQLNLMNVNNQVAGWRDKVWGWNQQQKYIQNYNYAQSLIGMGNQNMMKGADKLLGGITGLGASGALGGNKNSGGGFMPTMSNSSATSYMSMDPVQQGGVAGSPAGGISSIDPNSYSKSALIH